VTTASRWPGNAATRRLVARPLDAVRNACARVAARARFVRIDPERLRSYAAELPLDGLTSVGATALPSAADSDEKLAAFVLTLDAVNFGSGWFPELRKREGASGYRTLERALIERFERSGPFSCAELQSMDAAACAALFGQATENDAIAELMALFAQALRDLGEWLEVEFGGDYAGPAQAARGSAEALVRLLLEMPLYRDMAAYEELLVPFWKRAQLTAADLSRALPQSLGRFRDLDRLTIFADNLVPHVLRLDGVLAYDPELVARIDAGQLIPAGSPEEVEIRACAVHAVERLCEETWGGSTPCALDYWLWRRGGEPHYKARPRHRTRCAYY
jgi:hypothetical protein